MKRVHRFRLYHCSIIALALTALALGGCDGNDVPPLNDGPNDNLATAGLRLTEADIRATLGAGELAVNLVLERTGGAEAGGTVRVTLEKLGEALPVSQAESAFMTRGDRTAVAVRLPLMTPPDPANPADMANFVLRYRVEWDGAPLWGRRSLFAAVQLAETQLLSSDTFQANVPAYLRVMTRDPNSGEALAELPVIVSIQRGEEGLVPLFEGITDEFGQLAARIEPGEALVGDGQLIVQVQTPTGPQEMRANVAVQQATKVLITTDKPLYQPGQTMHLRALALRRPNLGPAAAEAVVFEIFDGKDNKVERVERLSDAYGIASFKFLLAREVNMGRYRIVTTVGDTITEKTVTVERYSLPKYDLDLELNQDIFFAGDHLVGTISAQYFFGQPVAGGTVAVSASTLDVGETVFANVQGATNEEGLFQFEFNLPSYIVGQPLEQGGGLVNLAVEITDTAGQSRSISRLVRIARGALEIVALPESGVYVPGVAQRLLIRATDPAGRPTAATHDVTINGVALDPVQTDDTGMAAVRFLSFDPQLTVQVLSTKEDDQVTNEWTFAASSAAPEGAVLLTTDRALYKVGDTLHATIQLAGATDRVYIDVIRGGQTVLTDMVQPDAEGRATFDLDLSPDHAGALRVSAYYLAQGSTLRRDVSQVYVDVANGLNIEFETDQPVYLPGEEATLTVRVTDNDGAGHAAAIGLQGVDEAVFSLMEFRPGLENTYFRIEGELAAPAYQIGVPSLSTITSAPGAVEDPVRQQEAELLFAAAGDQASHAISINTFATAQGAVLGVTRPFIISQLDLLAAEVVEVMNASNDPWSFDTAGWLSHNVGTRYDPWGQPLRIELVEQWSLTMQSRGPDELLGTADDLSVSKNLREALWAGRDDGFEGGGPPNAGGGDWDQDGQGPVAEPGAGGAGGDGPGAVRVRRNFPETLFVEPSLITDGSGEATMTIPLADSITTWRISALANSADGLLGSSDGGIRVFQDFFVDIDFPATLTRGDEFHVPVALYNYLDVPQLVSLEIEEADWFTLMGQPQLQVQLNPGEVAGIRLPIRVDTVGLHELTIIARGNAMNDGVARRILVEPDGQKVEQIVSGALEANVERTITIPAEAVPNSGKLLVKLYPGVFSQVVEGMDGILRMPGGCFEQTSSSTWPNVLVARYLDDSGSSNPEVMIRAMEYINTGYQRLLTFEVDGGGFEWFGNPPSHTVLTAYGLLEFTDMAQIRPVDADMIARTRAWLLGQQQADGHFEAARGLDETGLLTEPTTITAYVAFALAESGENGAEMARAKQYLMGEWQDMGTYTLALTANFMVAYQPNDAWTGQLLAKLAEAIEGTIEGQPGQHWQTDEQTTTYGQGDPAYIETTALATHALLAARAHGPLADQALAWLVTKKSPGGAWGSTAGTVWTIKCLLKSLEGGRDDNADATIHVLLDGEERATFAVTPETSDVMRQADLSPWLVPGQAHIVTLVQEGEGSLQYGIVASHHVPWVESGPGEGPLAITVEYDRTDLVVDDTVTATVTVTNNDVAFADMVMVDLGIPPGFDLITSDLDALVEAGVFSKYEHTERQLLLYFTLILPDNPVTFDYRLVARDPIRAQAPATRVYSYYNPEVGSEALPIEFAVD
jgi:hypothetical protein